jgi:pimeloyl-ACP methyl ester carboxylesterase
MKRHFVTVGSRQVHYRRAGAGPPVVFLHGSPQSSAFVEPVMGAVTDDYTAIGLDTPGYGNSDPLGIAWPSAADYADAGADTLDVLGIEAAAFYGTHTGAHIAMEVARRHPARTAALILDGISFNTPAERAELLARYAPPFVPSAAGEHLAWAWQHTRDQIVFYPWFRAEAERRLAVDIAGASYIHDVVQAKMEAGDGYRVGYAAAFGHDTFAAIANVKVPTAIMARPNDILTPQVKRIAASAPGNFSVVELSGDAGALADAMRHFLSQVEAGAPPAPPAAEPVGAGPNRRYADLANGQQIHCRQIEGEGHPLVLLHDEVGTSDLLAPLMARLAGSRTVIAIDLPGHGDSDAFTGTAPALDDYAQAVRSALDALRVEAFDLYGEGGGGLVAAAVAAGDSGRVARLVLVEPPLVAAGRISGFTESYSPEIDPTTGGGHLLAAWHRVRDAELFWPWCEPTKDAVRARDPILTADHLQARLMALLKSRGCPATCRAVFGADARIALGSAKITALVLAAPGDAFEAQADEAAGLLPNATSAPLPGTLAERADVIAAFLDGEA